MKKHLIIIFLILTSCSLCLRDKSSQRREEGFVPTTLPDEIIVTDKFAKEIIPFDHNVLSKKKLKIDTLILTEDFSKNINDLDSIGLVGHTINQVYNIIHYHCPSETDNGYVDDGCNEYLKIIDYKFQLTDSFFSQRIYSFNFIGGYKFEFEKRVYLLLLSESFPGGEQCWILADITDEFNITVQTFYSHSRLPVLISGNKEKEQLCYFKRIVGSDTVRVYRLENKKFKLDTEHFLILDISKERLKFVQSLPCDLINTKKSKWFFDLSKSK